MFLLLLIANFASVAPNINAMEIPEGAVIKTKDNPDVYIVKYKNGKQFKRLVLNPQVFESYGHLKWKDILIVSQSEINSFVTSDLVRVDGQTDIYQLIANGDSGSKHFVVFNNFDLDSIYTINDVDFNNYVTGDPKGIVKSASDTYVQETPTIQDQQTEIIKEDSLLKIERCKADAQLPLDKYNDELNKMYLESQDILKQWDIAISDVKIQYSNCIMAESPTGFSPSQQQTIKDAQCSYYLDKEIELEKEKRQIELEINTKFQTYEKFGQDTYTKNYLDCLNK